MQCLILAGGLGTRMRSVAPNTPKALLPVGDSTFIDYQLRWLKKLGVTEIILSLGHEGKFIEDYIEKNKIKNLYPPVKYSYDGPTLLGTGGAIKNAASLLDSDFLITYGDSFLIIDYAKVFNHHLQSKKPLTFTIFKNNNAGDKSNVGFENNHLKYDKAKPTPDMNYIDYGLSCLSKDFFLAFTTEQVFDLALFIKETCESGQATAYVADKMFYEIGSPDGYKRFLKLMSNNSFNLDQVKRDFSKL